MGCRGRGETLAQCGRTKREWKPLGRNVPAGQEQCPTMLVFFFSVILLYIGLMSDSGSASLGEGNSSASLQ